MIPLFVVLLRPREEEVAGEIGLLSSLLTKASRT
jgi:hypothetical protein